MYRYIVLCLVVLCGCSKSTPVDQKQDASVQQHEQTVTSQDAEALSDWYEPVFEYEYNYEPFSEEEIERLSLILYEQEERYLKGWFTEIHFIYKVNLGIPGGDNYIVLWTEVGRRTDGTISSTNKRIYIYSISDKIEHRYFAKPGFPITVETNFDIMENIPGFHIGFDTGASVYDFNGDGIDELFSYGFYGRGNFVEIFGYDAEKNEIVYYCNEVNFSIIDKDRGPAPVEFTYYKGRNGFKVYGRYHPRIPPVNIINNYYAWHFYSWNDETKKYENMGEYLPDETKAKYNIHAYSLEYFENRVKYEWITGEREVLVDLAEIKANIESGRSFNATVRDASSPTKDISNNIIDFDSDGKIVGRSWQ